MDGGLPAVGSYRETDNHVSRICRVEQCQVYGLAGVTGVTGYSSQPIHLLDVRGRGKPPGALEAARRTHPAITHVQKMMGFLTGILIASPNQNLQRSMDSRLSPDKSPESYEPRPPPSSAGFAYCTAAWPARLVAIALFVLESP
jgi:hypothetical protein